MERTARDLNRVVTRVAATVAAATAVTVPAVYFFTALIRTQEVLQDEAGEAAQAVSHFAFVNPRLWRFETLRITERLAQGHGLDPIAFRVLDATGDTVAEYRGNSATLAAPTIVRSVAIVESRRAIGAVEAVASLRPVLFGTALAALPGLGLALAGFLALRTLPLQALTRVSGRLVAARDELAASNAQLTREIAERRQTEQILRASEARLAWAQKLARLGHWVAAREQPGMPWHASLEYSAAAAAIFGVAPRELAVSDAAYVERFVHSDDRERVRQRFRDYVERRRRSEPLEYRIVRPDGEVRDIVEVSEEVAGDDGAPLYVIGTVQDVTDLRRTEAALRESQAMLRAVIDAVPAAINVKDLEGRYVLVNAYQADYHGMWTEEFVGKSAADIADEEYAREVRARERQVIETGEALGFYERQHRERDGSTSTWLATKVPLRDASGAVKYVVGVGVDISERKRLELDLMQAQKMTAVGQLSSGIAHDFNNLLTAVIGNLELLGERLDGDPESEKLIEIGLRAARRGADLTQRLLAFSRRETLAPVITDVNELAADMTDLLRHSLGELVQIDTVLAQDLWRALVDQNHLENAILNLAINARDAMPQGGRLVIETGNATLDEAYARKNAEVTAGDYVMVAISDTGTGMSPEVARRAFEPFFTTKEVGRGSGLGLSMVYGFIKQTGGHVRIYSEPGHGTTIRLYLPRALSDQPSDRPAPMAVPGPSGGGETVLVVENDRTSGPM